MLKITNLKENNKGFTLIELLIVIAIIGLLASIVLVGLSGFRARGRDARRIADIREVQNGLELYYTKNNNYPAISGADTWASLKTSLTGAGIGITTIPNDPLYPVDAYQYGLSGNQQNYVLRAVLEDPTNSSLNDSAHGTIFGLNCDSPAYCIQF